MNSSTVVAEPRRHPLENAGFLALAGVAATVHFSIAAAESFLAIALVATAALVVAGRERVRVPAMFWPLLVYAGLSLVAAFFSFDPNTSLYSSKKLVLFLMVPLVYRLARGRRADTLLHIVVTIGALSALYGVVQYGVLGYDSLSRRVQGSLGHWMTYSGLLMLVTCATLARLLFDRRDRVWPALILPALLVATVVTFTRSAWVGTCVAIAVLFAMKNLKLVALAPVVVAGALAVVLAVAPLAVRERVQSMVNLKDPTSSDRIAMLRAGARMVQAHPWTGVGQDVMKMVYPRYRDAGAVEKNQPHLHNVPVQIAAEAGLPALAAWCWFLVTLIVDVLRRFRVARRPVLAAAAMAAIGGMLGAGMFEYNFADSEFLILFLLLVTLPLAAGADEPRGSGESA
jgi:O-antigen ligase